MSENNEKSTGSAIGSIIGTIVLAAVCVAGGWIAKDMWPKGDGGAAAAQAAKLAAMAAMQQTVAVTNAEMRVYNLPERFVAHAEAVQEVDRRRRPRDQVQGRRRR